MLCRGVSPHRRKQLLSDAALAPRNVKVVLVRQRCNGHTLLSPAYEWGWLLLTMRMTIHLAALPLVPQTFAAQAHTNGKYLKAVHT